jgi:hypothetical protein
MKHKATVVQIFSHLLDETLGDWKTDQDPVELESKNKGE